MRLFSKNCWAKKMIFCSLRLFAGELSTKKSNFYPSGYLLAAPENPPLLSPGNYFDLQLDLCGFPLVVRVASTSRSNYDFPTPPQRNSSLCISQASDETFCLVLPTHFSLAVTLKTHYGIPSRNLLRLLPESLPHATLKTNLEYNKSVVWLTLEAHSDNSPLYCC